MAQDIGNFASIQPMLTQIASGIQKLVQQSSLAAQNILAGVTSAAGGRAALGLGTAAVASATNPAQTYVASVTGNITPGDVAVFADAVGTIKDGGALPTIGTAAAKAASNNADPTLASVTGGVTPGHLAVFADSEGSVEDGGAPPAPLAYQTGTWTPSLLFGGAAVGLTYAAQAGSYTRIGREIVCRFTITLSAVGSSTGAATIAGLPFTSNSDSTNAGAGGVVVSWSGMSSLAGLPSIRVGAGSTSVALNEPGAAASAALTNSNFGSSSVISGTFSYFV